MSLDQNPQQRLTRYACGFSVAQMKQFLLVYIPAKIKMRFIWKDDFFFLPKSSSSISRTQAHLAKRIQAYTEPHSFDGRIKLIIYQVRHWLSVTIHESSTNWKKNVRWRTHVVSTGMRYVLRGSRRIEVRWTGHEKYSIWSTCSYYCKGFKL